jgi:hypothetical protein
MTTLKSLPYFIKTSHQYKSFLQEMSEEDVLTIDPDLIINDLTIKNIDDFKRVLNMVTYWDFIKIPIELYAYAVNNREEVLSFLLLEDALHYKDFYTDVYYNLGLMTNKSEVINYLMFMNQTEHIEELKLTELINFSISTGIHDGYVVVSERRSHRVETSQELCFVIHLYVNNVSVISFRDTYSRLDKHFYSNGVQFECAMNMYQLLRKTIELVEMNVTELNFCNQKIVVTKFNKNVILHNMKSIYSYLGQVFESFFPLFSSNHVSRFYTLREDAMKYIEENGTEGLEVIYTSVPFIK